MKPVSNLERLSEPARPTRHKTTWPLLGKLRRIFRAIELIRRHRRQIGRSRVDLGKEGQQESDPTQISWKVAHSCVAGSRHLNRGCPCEDAAGSFVAGSLLGVAMADGAGSAARGGLGARVAVRAALAALRHTYLNGDPTTQAAAPEILRSAFRCALKSLKDEARRCSLPPSELACTLIVVFSDSHFVAARHVGDGAVVIRDASSDLITLSAPSNGEFANETVFLGCGGFNEDLRIVERDSIREIAVFTDGMQRLALTMPGGTPHPGFFGPLFKGLEQLTEVEAERTLSDFLRSPRVAARTDDDVSLLVAQIRST